MQRARPLCPLWAGLALCWALGAVPAAQAQPQIPPTSTQFGIMIDAGSSGSRAHLFRWKSRRFGRLPPPLSFPITNVSWTEKLKPGLSAYWQYPESVETVLSNLVDWAKVQLREYEAWWGYYPVYLKATAGLRELPDAPRAAIIRVVRDFLRDNKSCPFYFQEAEAARVISGEEEAAYAWAAINYATGALLEYSWGSGTAVPPLAFGSLEMGGASAQIAFFDPTQDILSNLFKVQVGQQKHWNIYAHSFLHYGKNSARRRMWSHLAAGAGCFGGNHKRRQCAIVDACLPGGFVFPPYLVPASSSGEGGLPPPMAYAPMVDALIRSPRGPWQGDTRNNASAWDRCSAQILAPLRLKPTQQGWCNYSHRGQCSFNGVYQPSLPDADGPYGTFFLFGEYNTVWEFLGLPVTASLRALRERGREICGMPYEHLSAYNLGKSNGIPPGDLPDMCFLAAYTFALLRSGYGIGLDRNLTSKGKVDLNGVRLNIGWPLGAMLYEINTLPWTYEPDESPLTEQSSKKRQRGERPRVGAIDAEVLAEAGPPQEVQPRSYFPAMFYVKVFAVASGMLAFLVLAAQSATEWWVPSRAECNSPPPLPLERALGPKSYGSLVELDPGTVKSAA